MTYDIEHSVKVQLNQFGLDILEDYYDGDYGREKDNMESMKIGKYYRMPLYLLMEIFGDYVDNHIRGTGPFVHNVIEME